MLQAEMNLVDRPVERAPFGAGSDFDTPTSTTTGHINILLVEDDDADAYLVEAALSGHARVGAIVRARDGVEALELVSAGKMKPDLAIVDLKMPRKDGFSLLLALRERVDAAFPAIVLTSSRAGADALRSRKRGALMFITKPSRLDKLTSVLGEVISDL